MSRPEGLERRPTHADLELERLRKTPIGPAFPEATPRSFRRAANRRRAARRRVHNLVVAKCLSCKWEAISTTWRPAKRSLADHAAKQHPKLAGDPR